MTRILSDSEGSRYLTIMRQMLLNTGRREGAASGGSPPLVPYVTTFPPAVRSGDKRKAPLWAG